VWHNGVAVHHNVEITGKTGNGKPEGPELLPAVLQDHGNPVLFRNIWVVDHAAPFPPGLPHPYPPVRDPGIQYGVYIPPLVHFSAWECPPPPRRAPSWFYYPYEAWR
jgi:hypothetical protein